MYEEDGLRGVNMEGGDLERMLRGIEGREMKVVMRKEVRGVGGKYVERGDLIEEFLGRKGVGYMGMNEGMERVGDKKDIGGLKNMVKEM